MVIVESQKLDERRVALCIGCAVAKEVIQPHGAAVLPTTGVFPAGFTDCRCHWPWYVVLRLDGCSVKVRSVKVYRRLEPATLP